jgi:hypothetical protein
MRNGAHRAALVRGHDRVGSPGAEHRRRTEEEDEQTA